MSSLIKTSDRWTAKEQYLQEKTTTPLWVSCYVQNAAKQSSNTPFFTRTKHLFASQYLLFPPAKMNWKKKSSVNRNIWTQRSLDIPNVVKENYALTGASTNTNTAMLCLIPFDDLHFKKSVRGRDTLSSTPPNVVKKLPFICSCLGTLSVRTSQIPADVADCIHFFIQKRVFRVSSIDFLISDC